MARRWNDWERKVPGVAWADVWAWADAIHREFGFYTHVVLDPPTGAPYDRWGTLSVQLYVLVPGVGAQVRHTAWLRMPEPCRCSAEQLALQQLVSLHQKLDGAVWASGEAAGPATGQS